MKTVSATFLAISITVPLASCVAVISRKTSSSAPASLYIFATSTGSPASIKLTKLTPFTTLPFFTSRHGMIRFANILFLLFINCQSSLKLSILHFHFFQDETVLQKYYFYAQQSEVQFHIQLQRI